MKISVDRHTATPLHIQLLQQIRELVNSGTFNPGSPFYSESELHRELQISRNTIRQALKNAEDEGLIQRVPGKGTFVTDHINPAQNKRLIGFILNKYISCGVSPSPHYLKSQLLGGAETTASSRGYNLIFCNSQGNILEENRLIDQLTTVDNVAGLMLWPIFNNDPSRRIFQLNGTGSVPIVLLDRSLNHLSYDLVTSKNHEGAYSAVQHLIALGHKRIVFLSYDALQVMTVQERFQGYQHAMQDAGLLTSKPWLIENTDQEIALSASIDLETVHNEETQQIMELMKIIPQPTAIFAMHDMMALQAWIAIRKLNLRIPEDISLVGFDDEVVVNAFIDTPITTVAQDAYELGKRATELLIQRIEGYQGPGRQVHIPTKLVQRNSTAPPKEDIRPNSS